MKGRKTLVGELLHDLIEITGMDHQLGIVISLFLGSITVGLFQWAGEQRLLISDELLLNNILLPALGWLLYLVPFFFTLLTLAILKETIHLCGERRRSESILQTTKNSCIKLQKNF